MFERLLVPLDASPNAEAVLPYATILANVFGEPVTLLSVLPETESIDAAEHEATMANVTEARRRYAQEYLEDVAARLNAAGVQTSVVVDSGPIPEVIVDTAARERAGLIAITSHTADADPWFVGSIANRVIRTAPTAVLVTQPPTEGTPAHPISEIIVPLDGSTLAEVALPYASSLAEALKAPITLLRATPPNLMITAAHPYGLDAALPAEVLMRLRASAEAYLDAAAAPLRARGIDVTTRFARVSNPADDITDLARQTDGALIVMATHGRSGLGRALLGSVTDRVIRSAAAPVLVVRAAAEDA